MTGVWSRSLSTNRPTIPVPVPSLLRMVIDWVVGAFLAIPGVWLVAYGASTLYTLTCTSASALTCSLDTGAGIGLLPLGAVMLVAGAIELYNAESSYALRSAAAQMVATGGSMSSHPPASETQAPDVTGARPCPYCGHSNRTEFAFCQVCGKQIPPIAT